MAPGAALWTGGFEAWRESLATDLAADVTRVLKQTIPATEEIRNELGVKTVQNFSNFAEAARLGVGLVALVGVPGTSLEGPCLERLCWTETRSILWQATWHTVQQHHGSIKGGPRAATDQGHGDDLPSGLWGDLSQETRITLSYWLVSKPVYRIALCLRYEIEESTDMIQRVLDRNAGAVDTLLCRARTSFHSYYTRLEKLNSPPFPAILFEALTGTQRHDMPECAKQVALTSALKWLRTKL
jgi:hypothetical protein